MNQPHDVSDENEAKLNKLCADGDVLANAGQETSDIEQLTESVLNDQSISQHLIRSTQQCSLDGLTYDTVIGKFRCQFAADQANYVLHFPIYPPMDTVPQVDVACDSALASVRLIEAKRFGLRLVVRRTDRHDASAVLVEVSARAKVEEQS